MEMNQEQMEFQLAALCQALEKQSIQRIYLTGCGGGIANLRPCEYVLKKYLEPGTVISDYAAEMMAGGGRGMDSHAVVIVGSFNGTMLEAVEAMRWAKSRGAFVIGVTYTPNTPIASEATFPFLCSNLEAEEYALSPMSAGVLLAFALVKALTGVNRLSMAWDNLLRLKEINQKAYEAIVKPRGEEFVQRFQKAPMIYTVGSGLNYYNAYIFATCYLLEMQWMNASPINAAEMFHGFLEMVDKDSNIFMLINRGEFRSIDERACAFLSRFTRGAFVLDAKEYAMDDIDPELETVVGMLVTAYVTRCFAHILADARHHPLTTRRYYLKFDY